MSIRLNGLYKPIYIYINSGHHLVWTSPTGFWDLGLLQGCLKNHAFVREIIEKFSHFGAAPSWLRQEMSHEMDPEKVWKGVVISPWAPWTHQDSPVQTLGPFGATQIGPGQKKAPLRWGTGRHAGDAMWEQMSDSEYIYRIYGSNPI